MIIDIESIRSCANGLHCSPELKEDVTGNVVGRTMSTIDYDFQTGQLDVGRNRAFAKLDVTTTGIIDPRGFADQLRIDSSNLAVQIFFYRKFDLVRQFGAIT